MAGGLGGFLRQTFLPPRVFEPAALEAEFRRDYAVRFAPHRRAAGVLALVTWLAYIGWDIFHGTQNAEIGSFLPTLLGLRAIGVVALAVSAWLAFRPAMLEEAYATTLFCASVAMAYGLILAMIVWSPFPFNYLYYFIGLLLVMIFMFGLLRLRARPVLFMTVGCLISTCAVLPFASTHGPFEVIQTVSSYYFLSAVTYLLSFAMVGCAIATELEQTARAAFSRERQLEEARRDTESKTAALVALKEDLRLRAETENTSKSKFLADAAHDLRQPMQALTNLLEAATHAVDRGDSQEGLRLMSMAQQALRITRSSFNAVLDISRLESGFVTAEPSSFEIHKLLEEVTSPLALLAQERQVRLKVRGSIKGPLAVRSDRHLLGRVLANLVSNAIKYSDHAKPAGPQVLVAVVALPARIRIDILDNGVGIPRAKWNEIFQPFVQLGNDARDREKGIGLGLSIVNAIVPLLDEHRIDMRSSEGLGSRFSLEIPRSDEAAIAPLATVGPDGEEADLAGAYVIYVEDDVLVRQSAVALMQEYGVLFEVAGSLAELEGKLAGMERMPDLIISDYRLPAGKTAVDVLTAVHGHFGEDIPYVVVTGEVLDLERHTTLDRGRVLRKPIGPETLLREIGRAIRP
ncbi:MAG: hybrid sensor histidine kinase/response regulator [Phenylobacterium sp.]|uniref:hybrid sensor histidine kinase/response regulator n=1 Tax=Phenylobacterium sp. TaxID=1871053 RepID=UPI003BB6326A